MKMAKIHLTLFLLALIFGFSAYMGSVNAMTHVVGGGHGWRVPHNKTFFDEWAKPRTFGVGDRLIFPYRPGSNNVVVVDKDDFDVCGQKKVINMYYNGPTIVNLTETGECFYYSGVGKHCEAGQKLHIKVVNEQGSSGKSSPDFKLVGHVDSKTAAPAPAALPDHLDHNSSATTIHKFCMVSGLLAFLVSLLMI